MFRPQPINSTNARKYFTQIINKVRYGSKSFVIESYHRPTVRIVNENYIAALEQVLGKKTVNQILQIAGNDQLLETDKIGEIKKTFQRRLSGQPRQQTPPAPKTPPESQVREAASPSTSGGSPKEGGGVMLPRGGKNYA